MIIKTVYGNYEINFDNKDFDLITATNHETEVQLYVKPTLMDNSLDLDKEKIADAIEIEYDTFD